MIEEKTDLRVTEDGKHTVYCTNVEIKDQPNMMPTLKKDEYQYIVNYIKNNCLAYEIADNANIYPLLFKVYFDTGERDAVNAYLTNDEDNEENPGIGYDKYVKLSRPYLTTIEDTNLDEESKIDLIKHFYEKMPEYDTDIVGNKKDDYYIPSVSFGGYNVGGDYFGDSYEDTLEKGITMGADGNIEDNTVYRLGRKMDVGNIDALQKVIKSREKKQKNNTFRPTYYKGPNNTLKGYTYLNDEGNVTYRNFVDSVTFLKDMGMSDEEIAALQNQEETQDGHDEEITMDDLM